MEGVGEAEEESQEKQTSFVWDENTHLYFHASSGFYHEPVAGWYYSSRDGLYYQFVNGSYVLLSSDEVGSCTNLYDHSQGISGETFVPEHDSYQCSEIIPDEGNSGDGECGDNESLEIPPPPSEWLEETLINLYLSGYNQTVNAADNSTACSETDVAANNSIHMLESDDAIAQEHCGLTGSGESVADKDDSRDEENWRMQYGQVVHSGDESPVGSFVVDLWDWTVITDSRKDKKAQVARLVGRLVKQSTKLHPSMPSNGGLFKTAPICEVNLDLVQVRTGQVYKLHNPSAKYLASLPTYDSSNPTKDWGFPEFSINMPDISLKKSSESSELESYDFKVSSPKKQRSHVYRDRAAERRTLHGGFGVGPGQKISSVIDTDGSLSHVPTNSEEAAAEALNISFGADSYARKMLESMGWKEGEALGNTVKGLIEPIQPVGNIGNAGLGWPRGRTTDH